MMLRIVFPDGCRAEKRWIADVVLGEWLGLSFEIAFDEGSDVRIVAPGAPGARGETLSLPEVFFALASAAWLGRASLPPEPLAQWRPDRCGLQPPLLHPAVPVLYGVSEEPHAGLPIDIFGSAFFMLTRYEEAVSDLRDGHERFPLAASLAHRYGFVERPLVDEYVEILWAALARRWPRLERKTRTFKTVVSCDVDHPYHPSARSLGRLAKRAIGEAIRRRSLAAALAPVRNHIASRRGDWRGDPYYHTVDWMMEVNERAGNTVAFYFIPEITDAAVDDTCALTDPAVIAMIRRIAARGHEIGIHPGYRTYRSSGRIRSGLDKLQRLLRQQDIEQRIAGGRQHYLRWSVHTPGAWDAAGLHYDSTLGYAERAGFRCGTSREFPMFDLCERRALRLRQRPLICMEVSVIQHMGYGVTEAAWAKMAELKAIVRKFNGDFTLLWHNSGFEAAGAKEMYCGIIA